MRKILPGVLAVLMPALVLAGCSGGGGSPAPPGPSVRGTWRSDVNVSPPVTVIVRDYLGSREMGTEQGPATCYFYSGEIQSPIFTEGVCPITAIPSETEGSSSSFIYAMTVLGLNYLCVRGVQGPADTLDEISFIGLLDANTAEGLLMITDDNGRKWSDIATFTRS